jgi:hypothetical protein
MFCAQMLLAGELPVCVPFEFEQFRNSFDDQVRVGDGVTEVGGEAKVPQGCFGLAFGSAGYFFRLVDAGEACETGPRFPEGAVVDVIGGDRESVERGLVGDLRAEHSGAEHGERLDMRHGFLSTRMLPAAGVVGSVDAADPDG